MIKELYNRSEEIEVSLSSGSQKEFTFRSEIKNLTYDFIISKFRPVGNNLESLVERETYFEKFLDDKLPIDSKIKLEDSSQERMEAHLRLYDENMNSIYFYFDLGSDWTNGGRFFIRRVEN